MQPIQPFRKVTLALLPILLAACNRYSIPQKTTSNIGSTLTDYSKIQSWASHPDKWDPADSVPLPFRGEISQSTGVDVFFIHPTTYTADTNTSWNASVNDSLLNIKTDYSSILYQASAFNEGNRIFAPRYRQAHYRSFFTTEKDKAELAFEEAYKDIEAAFEWFREKINLQRPLIIAAHSQGTLHAARLIKKYFDQPDHNKLVAAYLIGMPVPTNYFKYLIPCSDSLQNGCIISWRTYQRGYVDTNYVSKETFKAIVTNPLTWDTNAGIAVKAKNIGGILKNFNKLRPGVVNAEIRGNILWSSKPAFFGSFLIRQKNYHVGDINLFYANIRQNVRTRIRNWKKTYQSPY